MVQTVNYQMEVPKESKEIADALSGLVEHFKSGKSLSDAAVLLPSIMAAVDGYDKVKEEVQSKYSDEAAGYLVHKILGALKAEKPVQPAA